MVVPAPDAKWSAGPVLVVLLAGVAIEQLFCLVAIGVVGVPSVVDVAKEGVTSAADFTLVGFLMERLSRRVWIWAQGG